MIKKLTGMEGRLERRRATALSKLAYSSERTAAIILSLLISFSSLFRELKLELEQLPSFSDTCVILKQGDYEPQEPLKVKNEVTRAVKILLQQYQENPILLYNYKKLDLW